MSLEKKARNRKIPALAVIILCFFVVFAGITAARYVMQQTKQGIVAAQDFYFTSDFLKAETDNVSYYIDPDMDFTVHLYHAEDSLRKTLSEIEYSVSVTGGTWVDSGSGTLKPDSGTADLTVTPNTGATSITVTATSTKPYKKVLTAVFKVEKGNSVVLEDSAGNRAAVLTMTCADAPKTITITLPSGVIPDETNDNVASYDAAGRVCEYHSPGYGVYSLILLKSNPDGKLEVQSGSTFAGSLEIISN